MKYRKNPPLMIFAVVAVALSIVAALIVFAPNGPTVPPVALPTPNGYDTLGKASVAFVGLPTDFGETNDVESLRSCVESNAAAFDLIGQASMQDCAVPIDYDAGVSGVIDRMNTQSIRPAMRLLIVKARLAELEGDFATAAATQIELLSHAERIANEGVLVHAQVALAYQTSAMNDLIRLVPKLNAEQKTAALAKFQESPRPRMSIDAIRMRDEALWYQEVGVIERWQFRRLRMLATPAYRKLRAQRDTCDAMFAELMDLLRE